MNPQPCTGEHNKVGPSLIQQITDSVPGTVTDTEVKKVRQALLQGAQGLDGEK